MTVRYYKDDMGKVGFVFVPTSMKKQIVPEFDCRLEPLIQCKLVGDAYPGPFACGHTMRDSGTVKRISFTGQEEIRADGERRIETSFAVDELSFVHKLTFFEGYDAAECCVSVENKGGVTVSLEMLHSFSLGMLTPFENGIHKENLNLYRMPSRWASEAHLEKKLAEELLLVPSFLEEEIFCVSHGQIGSKPTDHYIPFVGIEDIEKKVLWGAQISCASSWKIELVRTDNGLSVSGGLADYDYGAWMKELRPGDEFTTPPAYLTVCGGDIDDLCARLTGMQKRPLAGLPQGERDLPVIFNEWCTTWGDPCHTNMEKLADTLKGWPVRYLVMDSGWFKGKEHEWFEMGGDWIPSKEKYPDGLKVTCDMVREHGFIPGIWFEFETCGLLSAAFAADEHLIRRFGKTLVVNNRKFWDFRDPWTWDYLCRRVIGLMKECGIGYIKVDSNDTMGIGGDGAESLGETLRQNIVCVNEFFHEMRRQIPELVIENCSSGGHRLTADFMEVSSLCSFSDAFETEDIPIIAANLQRVIQPCQSGIWCIVRKKDDAKRLHYSLASIFLGRAILSGDVHDLSVRQKEIVLEGLSYYEKAKPVIGNGFSRRYGPCIPNYREPDGWQAVVRTSRDERSILIVAHCFRSPMPICVEIPLPDGVYDCDWSYKTGAVDYELANGKLLVAFKEEKEGAVMMLKKQ